jgi:hypothetical protein
MLQSGFPVNAAVTDIGGTALHHVAKRKGKNSGDIVRALVAKGKSVKGCGLQTSFENRIWDDHSIPQETLQKDRPFAPFESEIPKLNLNHLVPVAAQLPGVSRKCRLISSE